MKCKTLNPLNSETMYNEKEWPEDPYEGFCLRRDNEQCEDEPLSLYEKYPLDSSYYQTAM